MARTEKYRQHIWQLNFQKAIFLVTGSSLLNRRPEPHTRWRKCGIPHKPEGSDLWLNFETRWEEVSNFDPPTAKYRRGWGPHALGATLIIESWSISLLHINGLPVTLTFDMSDDDSSITMEMYVKQNSITNTTSITKCLSFKISSDNKVREMLIYEYG